MRVLELLLITVGALTLLRMTISSLPQPLSRLPGLRRPQPSSPPSGPFERASEAAAEHPQPTPPEPEMAEQIRTGEGPHSVRLTVGAGTRAGFRGTNDDGYLVQDRLLAVADGVGGGAAGGYAAKLALRTIAAADLEHASSPRAALEFACAEANRALLEHAREDPRLAGMATTLDIMLYSPGLVDQPAVLAHAGNGTVYLQFDDEPPVRITEPHATSHGPLLRAVGLSRNLKVDLDERSLHRGDRILIVTDGLTNGLEDDVLLEAMTKLRAASPQQTADALVAAAAEAGSGDDVTVVVADLS